MTQLLIFLSLLPALFWFFIFLRKDRFDPEPKSLLTKLFIFGAVAAVISGILEITIVFLLPGQYSNVFDSLSQVSRSGTDYYLVAVTIVIVFAAIEEILKIAVVYFLAYKHTHFNQIVDGAIFGVSVALGFATLENLGYFTNSFNTKGLAALVLIFLLRFFSSSLLHVLTTGLAGYYLGKAKFTQRPFIFWQGLIAAILMHSTFNLFLLGGTVLGLLLESVLLGFMLFFLLKRMGSSEAQTIRNLLLLRNLGVKEKAPPV